MGRRQGAAKKVRAVAKATKRPQDVIEDSQRDPSVPQDITEAHEGDTDLPSTGEDCSQEEEVHQPDEVRQEGDHAADVEATPSQGSQGSKQRKARLLSKLTDAEQEQVAVFLESNDFIFNKRRFDHCFADRKHRAWEEEARNMGKQVKDLTTFFDSIRTQMGKMRRKSSGQGTLQLTERQQWIWTRFQFLVPHIGHVTRRTVQSLKPATTQPATAVPEDRDPDVEMVVESVPTPPQESTPNSSITTASSSRGGSRKRRGTAMEEEEDIAGERSCSRARQMELMDIIRSNTDNAVPFPARLKYGEFLGHSFQQLPHVMYIELREKMSALLTEAEKKFAVMEQSRQGASPAPPPPEPAASVLTTRPSSTSSTLPMQPPRQWHPPYQQQGQWHGHQSQWHSNTVMTHPCHPAESSWIDQQPGTSMQSDRHTFTIPPTADSQQHDMSAPADDCYVHVSAGQ